MQTNEMLNIGIIEKIKRKLNTMYIYIKLDLSVGDKNLIFLNESNYKLTSISQEFEVNKDLYAICKDAKIHRLKCAFEVSSENGNMTISAITLL